MENKLNNIYWVGIDVGSTTVKIAVVDPKNKKLLHSKYVRHNAKQPETVYDLMSEAHNLFPDSIFKVAVCGSGGEAVVSLLNAFFIQEVVANSIAIKEFYKRTKVAIELGGQDAKVIFFHYDDETKQIMASDMRMNGSCAGGTGAFIDQVAELINVKTEEFGSLAMKGRTVYDISGRCGVFAKTDIQPLLNQGVSKEDIALSTFHAIAKQTIGGLAQGMEIKPPVIFEGGPLTFNPRLIEVFAERLGLKGDEIIIPEKPEIIVAYGTALSIGIMFNDKESLYDMRGSLHKLKNYELYRKKSTHYETDLFFNNELEKERFSNQHKLEDFKPKHYEKGSVVTAYLGIDAGSTTSKFVLLNENEEIIDKFYANNDGDPLRVIQKALIEMRNRYNEQGITLNIKAVGTTGYGEVLFAKAFKADYHTVETVSHAEAAMKYAPNVSFILDIGGQDMKAISIKGGIVTGIVLNEACSAGCGSFIETYAKSLKIPVHELSRLAFESKSPSRLGSRCTVFMNSSIVTEQKNGKTTEDIIAGICKSIIENVFTKVVRIPNFNMLGDVVVVQGGTFKNDAVLRALEQYTERTVVRAPHPGEMGAIGIALLTKKYITELEIKTGQQYESTFIGLEKIELFNYEKQAGNICQFCSNNCNRTLVKFNDGTAYITGNRCERGEIIGDPKDEHTKELLKETTKKMQSVPDMMTLRNELLFKDYNPKRVSNPKNITIGIPRTLEFWNSIPFWKAFFTSLGFNVVISRKSDYKLFESGLNSVASDTVCFPAKLGHGHVRDLISRKVDRIFMPMMIKIPAENQSTNGVYICAVIQGYPLVVKESDEPETKHNIPFDHPVFHWYNYNLRDKQIIDFIQLTFGLPTDIIKEAISEGDKALNSFNLLLKKEGSKVLNSLEGTNNFAVILAGRPYHTDELINHSLSKHFTRMGIPVLTIDSIPGINQIDLSRVRAETTNPFHVRMYGAAVYGARHPNLEVVQVVSFGCGHDAVITDEMMRLMSEISDKQLLVLKLDEGEAKGPLNIRIKSFIETIKSKRKLIEDNKIAVYKKELPDPFEHKFDKKEAKVRTLLAPNISEAFCKIITSVIRTLGIKVEPLPLAGPRAFELGKKYVHNDICFPAQVNIGELLAELEKGQYKPEQVVAGFAKNCDDCRAGQYATLARKALDDAGYTQIPILTTGTDTKNMHPGFRAGIKFQIRMLWGLAIIDAMEDMLRKTRPYELNKGESDRIFYEYIDKIASGLENNVKSAMKMFKEAVKAFNNIPINRNERKPLVFIIGEILLNFHPASNNYIMKYLENNGMETILPSLIDFFRRDLIRVQEGSKRHHIEYPIVNLLLANITDKLYDYVLRKVNKIHSEFRLYEPTSNIHQIANNIESIIDKTYMVGEGWTIPAEILEHIKKGVNSFIIIQPFGCLPNHITGRGMIKAIKKRYPYVQILSIDYDPDTSFANVENRLQMLIITAKESEKRKKEITMH